MDIALPMVEDLLEKFPELPLPSLVHKLTAYKDQDKPVQSKRTRVKVADWAKLPADDLRNIYARGPKESVYERFKQEGLIFDLPSFLSKAK